MILIIILNIVIILLIACGIHKVLEDKYLKEIEVLEETDDSKTRIIRKQEKTITSKKKDIEKGKDEVESLKKQLDETKERLSSTIQENNSKIDNLTMQLEIKDQLLIKEQKKNKELNNERISYLGTITAKEKKISNLENEIQNIKEKHKEELAKKDYTINYLKKNMRAPTLKELKDYQFKRKKSSDKYV